MSKYVIVDAEVLQERIEKLKKKNLISSEVKELRKVLSQSTPLIPQIEKAYWAGMQFVGEDKGSPNEYISNLKLDI